MCLTRFAPKAGGTGVTGPYDPTDPLAAIRMAQEALANTPFGHGPLSHLGIAEDMQAQLEQAAKQIQGNTQALGPYGGIGGVSAMAAGAAMGTPSPAGQPQPGSDPVSQLERLAALRNSGALTEEEFAAQKRRVLDGD